MGTSIPISDVPGIGASTLTDPLGDARARAKFSCKEAILETFVTDLVFKAYRVTEGPTFVFATSTSIPNDFKVSTIFFSFALDSERSLDSATGSINKSRGGSTQILLGGADKKFVGDMVAIVEVAPSGIIIGTFCGSYCEGIISNSGVSSKSSPGTETRAGSCPSPSSILNSSSPASSNSPASSLLNGHIPLKGNLMRSFFSETNPNTWSSDTSKSKIAEIKTERTRRTPAP